MSPAAWLGVTSLGWYDVGRRTAPASDNCVRLPCPTAPAIRRRRQLNRGPYEYRVWAMSVGMPQPTALRRFLGTRQPLIPDSEIPDRKSSHVAFRFILRPQSADDASPLTDSIGGSHVCSTTCCYKPPEISNEVLSFRCRNIGAVPSYTCSSFLVRRSSRAAVGNLGDQPDHAGECLCELALVGKHFMADYQSLGSSSAGGSSRHLH